MNELIKQLKRYCAESAVCLWFSGDNRSRLLLELMLRSNLTFSICLYESLFSKAEKKLLFDLIIEKKLKVYSYLPSQIHFFKKDGVKFIVPTFLIDTDRAIDFDTELNGEQKVCPFDLSYSERSYPPIIFDVNINGAKFTSKYSDAEILLMLKELGVEQLLTKKARPVCTNCLTEKSKKVYCFKEKGEIAGVGFSWEKANKQFEVQN